VTYLLAIGGNKVPHYLCFGAYMCF
jgi:hypothetical protein